MGTNFYTKDGEHIGKRAMAGNFCKECGVSYTDAGYQWWSGKTVYNVEAVHVGDSTRLDLCPICQKPIADSQVVCSFTFAVSPKKLLEIMMGESEIVDEYGTKYTIPEFKTKLREYPIKYWHFVGIEFC